jgi:hypothetical protein
MDKVQIPSDSECLYTTVRTLYFVTVFSNYLEYRTMDKVQKPGDCHCIAENCLSSIWLNIGLHCANKLKEIR